MYYIYCHKHPEYITKWNSIGANRWNGAYYYSREIYKNIIPRIKTDRSWITIKVGDHGADHSICFVHNNLRFEKTYSYMRRFRDVIFIVGLPDMVEKAQKFGPTIYLPLSVDVAEVEQYKTKKTKKRAFVGRKATRRDWKFEPGTEMIEGLPRQELLKEMAKFEEVYAIGRTAVEAKVLGCRVLPFHPRLPDPELWQIVDNKEAAGILQEELDRIDGAFI